MQDPIDNIPERRTKFDFSDCKGMMNICTQKKYYNCNSWNKIKIYIDLVMTIKCIIYQVDT